MSAEATIACDEREQTARKLEERVERWSRATRDHLLEAMKHLNSREPALFSAQYEIGKAQEYAEYAYQDELELREMKRRQ